MKMGSFFAGEASRLAGFEKPWMLNYLERAQIYVRESAEDRRHGKVRKYTFRDIVALRAIKKMLDIGLRPIRIKEVLKQIAIEEGLPDTREAAQVFSRKANSILFISKDEILLAKTAREIVNLASGRQLSFSFMVSINSIIDEIAPVAQTYEKERSGNWKHDCPRLDGLCKAAGL